MRKFLFLLLSLVITLTINSVQGADNAGALEKNELVALSNSMNAAAPVVDSVASAIGITNTTAFCGSFVSSDGGDAITEKGVCWSTSANPTITDSKIASYKIDAASPYEPAYLTGLIPNTMYHVRAYATNSSGTSYSGEKTFTTLNSDAEVVWPLFNNIEPVTTGDVSASLLDTTHFRYELKYDQSTGGTPVYGTGWCKLPMSGPKIQATYGDTIYLAYSVTPESGKSLKVSKFNLCALGYKTGAMKLAVYYSFDDFATAGLELGTATANTATRTTYAATSESPVSLGTGNPSTATSMGYEFISFSPDITVPAGKTLSVRLYAFGKAGGTMEIKDLVISGNTNSAAGGDELAAYWKLDGNANDELGVSNGTLINGSNDVWVDGLVDGAINFAGTTDSTYVLVPHNDVIDFDSTQNFSVSLLVKGADLAESWLFVKGSSGKNNADHPTWDGKRYEMFFSGPNLRWVLDDDVTKSQAICNNAFTSEYMDMSGWNHLVGVRDVAQDSLFIFINGNKVASVKDNTDLNISNTSPLIIGQLETLGKRPSAAIDEFQIINKALSPSDVKAMYKSYFPVVIPENCVALWKMEGDVNDELGASNGTLVNGNNSLFVPGLVGKAIDMNLGTDSTYINVDDNSIIDFDSTASFTVSVLLKIPDVSVGEVNVFTKGYTANVEGTDKKGCWYTIAFKSGELRFALDDNVNKTQLGIKNVASLMDMGGWNHIVAIRDIASATMTVYINGLEAGSIVDVTTLNIASGPLPLTIGNNQDRNHRFTGMIDELAFYNKAMDASEVKAMYDAYFPVVLPENCVAWWKLDGNAKDETGNCEDGILNDITTEMWVSGIQGKAINLGAGVATSNIEIPINPTIDFGTGSFSASVVLKFDEMTSAKEVLFKGYTSTDANVPGSKGNWYALSTNGTTVRLFIDDNVTKTNLDYETGGKQFHETDWNHIVTVRDTEQDSLKIYINGVRVAALLDATELTIESAPLPWIIGGGGKKDNNFKGQIDDVRLYDKALSAQEISDLTKEYGIEAVVNEPASTDATLKEIFVGGTALAGFQSSVTSYDIELAEGTTSAPTVTATATDDKASVVIMPATTLPGKTSIRVTAEDQATVISYAINFTVAEKDTTAVKDYNTRSISLYPNPVNDVLNIENAENLKEISIYNLNGSLVLHKNFNGESTQQINVELLTGGVYFVKALSTNNTIATSRFVK